MSIEELITTEPVKISPYTKGTGVPALLVCCVPLKLKDNLGSCSELNWGILGVGNNISLTPLKTNPAPIPKAAFAPKPAAANPPAPKDNGAVNKPPTPKLKAINAPPNKALPIPPEPDITGTNLISDRPTGKCNSSILRFSLPIKTL